MGVVRVGSGSLATNQSVNGGQALHHRVLGDAGDAVLGVGDDDAVPMEGDALVDVGVVEPGDLDELADGGVDLRTGRGAIEGVAVDLVPVGEA